jgi:hypothetical protein
MPESVINLFSLIASICTIVASFVGTLTAIGLFALALDRDRQITPERNVPVFKPDTERKRLPVLPEQKKSKIRKGKKTKVRDSQKERNGRTRSKPVRRHRLKLKRKFL